MMIEQSKHEPIISWRYAGQPLRDLSSQRRQVDTNYKLRYVRERFLSIEPSAFHSILVIRCIIYKMDLYP